MLEDLQRQSSEGTSTDPILNRLEEFLKDYARYILQGNGTDEESRRLELEIAWVRVNNDRFSWPLRVFDWLTTVLRAETPKYKKLMTEFMADHMNFITTGRGDIKRIAQQIQILKNEGLLPESDAASLLDALSPSITELELLRFGRIPWWKRIFG